MSEYPDELTREFWLAIGRLALMALLVAVVFAITRYATRITPEREAELKAQGAAEADRKADAVGGWSKWLARAIGGDFNGQDARCPSVASADGQDARRPSREVR